MFTVNKKKKPYFLKCNMLNTVCMYGTQEHLQISLKFSHMYKCSEKYISLIS